MVPRYYKSPRGDFASDNFAAMMDIGFLLPRMPQRILYRYPFDEEGHEILTLGESIAAMQELEHQINRLCSLDWRWCDLRLSIIERHPTYVIYEIHHGEAYSGRAVVMPCASPLVTCDPALADQALLDKIQARIQAKTTQ